MAITNSAAEKRAFYDELLLENQRGATIRHLAEREGIKYNTAVANLHRAYERQHHSRFLSEAPPASPEQLVRVQGTNSDTLIYLKPTREKHVYATGYWNKCRDLLLHNDLIVYRPGASAREYRAVRVLRLKNEYGHVEVQPAGVPL